ncbi:MAG: hypothetical protein KAQ66_02685, partial [Rhodospirillaceae bacterium]|nr:hypothetical protein [Rhodospirillaceae bacterium]
MRNTIIGIVIGIVVGVMLGATVIAPRLELARPQTARHDGKKTENLSAAESSPDKNSVSRKAFAGDVSPLGRLRTASSFPRDLPHLGAMAVRLEDLLGDISGGTFDLKVYDPGVMVPIADTFRAVQSGTLEAAFSSPGQWAGEIPALQLFSSIPFGP